MIRVESVLKISDNSGGVFCSCIRLLKVSSRTGAIPGQVITCVIKKVVFKKHVVKKSKIITKGQLCKALLICTAKGIKRWGNFLVRSKINRVVLINQYNMPYATRLFGPVFREVRLKVFFSKVISLAQITI